MGVDFIVSQTKTFKRSWDRGLSHLEKLDLFTRHPEEQKRTYRGVPRDGHAFKVGQECLLRVSSDQNDILVFEDVNQIGSMPSLPASLVGAISQDGSGVAIGTVQTVHEISGIADIAIK